MMNVVIMMSKCIESNKNATKNINYFVEKKNINEEGNKTYTRKMLRYAFTFDDLYDSMTICYTFLML